LANCHEAAFNRVNINTKNMSEELKNIKDKVDAEAVAPAGVIARNGDLPAGRQEQSNGDKNEPKKHGLFHRQCEKCEAMKKEAEEAKGKWLRALADYQNLQKETAARRAEWAQISEQQILEEFIPVYEHLKKAFAHCLPLPEGEQAAEGGQRGREWQSWQQGIAQIMKQFADILKSHGVEEIKTVDEIFDPKFHEAVGHEAFEGIEPEIVAKEIEGGYKMGERVIRAAKVIVAK